MGRFMKAILKVDTIGAVDVCTAPCPRVVWIILLLVALRHGVEVFLGDMSWVLAWMQGVA